MAIKQKKTADKINVMPRNNQDYYPIGVWLVSKRLAFMLVIILFIISVIYLIWCLPFITSSRKLGYPVFYYRSLPLKFYQGKAEIIGKAGTPVYAGQVNKGTIQGSGILYDKEGQPVYKGQLSGGKPEGKGTLFRPDGTKEYKGQFSDGKKQGSGSLYNQSDTPIFDGEFSQDQIVFEKFVGNTATEISGMYSGNQCLYDYNDTICTYLSEINVLYYAENTQITLEQEWKSGGVYVLQDSFVAESQKLSTPEELKQYFGDASYQGTTVLTFPDVAALSLLSDDVKVRYPTLPELTTKGTLVDAQTVTAYSRNLEGYIYTFKKDTLQYTFFTYSQSSGFGYYLIEQGE